MILALMKHWLFDRIFYNNDQITTYRICTHLVLIKLNHQEGPTSTIVQTLYNTIDKCKAFKTTYLNSLLDILKRNHGSHLNSFRRKLRQEYRTTSVILY